MRVSLSDVVRELNEKVTVLYGENLLKRKRVSSSDLNRPGLLLAGFTKEFPKERIQILGLTERAYLLSLMKDAGVEAVVKSLRRLFSRRIPSVVLTAIDRKLPSTLNKMIMECAHRYRVPLLGTTYDTSSFMAMLSDRLSYLLAPREFVHGVVVEVHGVGVLLMGDPGVGKSETALEMIRRGHRFVSDDMIMVKRYPPNALLAEPPTDKPELMFFIYVRGIGTIYIPHYFGVGAIRRSYPIHIVVELSDDPDLYDTKLESMEILGIVLPKYRLKLHPLKATATVIESMALHHKANAFKDMVGLPDFSTRLKDKLNARRG
ncbi:MAG: HPr kinase/phosphorylase [Thermotogae bacterium]|nr:HPr kinase/phosphorylase [Thermotogota bacterium]